MERLQLGPLQGLRLSDEGEDGLRKDRALAVEAVWSQGRVAVCEEMGFDDGFESSFVRVGHRSGPRTNRALSARSISNGFMHLMPRPMQASGILILRADPDGTSWVTTVCLAEYAWATR